MLPEPVISEMQWQRLKVMPLGEEGMNVAQRIGL
jgi:hypothetical protein